MKKILSIFTFTSFATFLLPVKAFAHCPLCTGGAGAAAAAAAMLGVRYGAIAVFLGGFSVALSLWLSHKVKKQYFKHQQKVLFWTLYLSTLLPMYPFLKGDYTSQYISISGEYGNWLNRTYLIDLFIVGAIIGSLIVYFSPALSALLTKKRGGKMFPFQGLIITFFLLTLVSAVMQFLPR